MYHKPTDEVTLWLFQLPSDAKPRPPPYTQDDSFVDELRPAQSLDVKQFYSWNACSECSLPAEFCRGEIEKAT